MKLTAGTKLKSVVCSAEVIVIRPPGDEGVLSCGEAPMAMAAATDARPQQLAEPQASPPLIGKRYVDADAGIEVLCTKGGKGALAFDGRPLALKEAKPLPASD